MYYMAVDWSTGRPDEQLVTLQVQTLQCGIFVAEDIPLYFR